MLRPFLSALLLGLIAAGLFVWLDMPLPWMTGPLFGTAALRLAGRDLRCPVPVREAGQWAIGAALGLYFTAPVLGVLASYAGYIAAAVVFALVLGWAFGALLQRLAGIDRTTAFFSMAIGGASEMAVQGEHHGAAVEQVAAAHSLRIMLVVAIIPFGIRYWGRHGLGLGHDIFVPGAATVDYGGLLALIVLTSGAALACRKMRMPNAWVIGPLLMSLLLTAADINLSRIPEWMLRLGQLCIGISLGTRFTPGFLRTAPRFLLSVALCCLGMMAIGTGFGIGLASLAGINPGTAILATSPGGIAEMSLTARTLNLGVPIVVAFHVSRLVVLVLSIGPAYRLASRLNGTRET